MDHSTINTPGKPLSPAAHNLRIVSYPGWSKPIAERLQAVQIALKFYGFKVTAVTPEVQTDGE